MVDLNPRAVAFLLVLSALVPSCQEPVSRQDVIAEQLPELSRPAEPLWRDLPAPEFDTLLRGAGLRGSILIAEEGTWRRWCNNFSDAGEGELPASTFKIPNSIIALECGIVEDAVTLLRWDGTPRAQKAWESDLTFREAFQRSCLPCYQEIAREIGLERMRSYLERFSYGDMTLDSASLDRFWIEGPSTINSYQQIDFLRRFLGLELPVSAYTIETMKEMMVVEEDSLFRLCGKTGWSVQGDRDIGWFVGFLEKPEGRWYFSTKVEPLNAEARKQFAVSRRAVTRSALVQLGLLPEPVSE